MAVTGKMRLPATAIPIAGQSVKQVISVPDQLGPILKAARKTAGLSQTALAKKLRVSQSRVSDMELYPRSLTLEQFMAILSQLNLEMTLEPKKAAGDDKPSAW